jgi:hypothetical protein
LYCLSFFWPLYCLSFFWPLYCLSFFWPLYCLSFFDLWLLITPLVSSKFSCSCIMVICVSHINTGIFWILTGQLFFK